MMAFVILVTAAPGMDAQAGGGDVLRGRVTGVDSVPLSGIEVVVRSASTRRAQTTRTARDGTYVLRFIDRSEEYEVQSLAIGRKVTRAVVRRGPTGEFPWATLQMERLPQMLERVSVSGRPPVGLGAGFPDVDQTVGGGVVVPRTYALAEDNGDLAKIASLIPGATYIADPDGGRGRYSIAGAPPLANTVSLGGSTYEAGTVPALAATVTKITTATADVARGSFGGALITGTELTGWFPTLDLHLLLDDPSLQFTDPASPALGRTYRRKVLQTSLALPWGQPLSFVPNAPPPTHPVGTIRLSTDLSHREAPVASLFTADSFALRGIGVGRDSLERLRGVLGRLHVPETAGSLPSATSLFSATSLLTVDVAGIPWLRSARVNGGWSRSDPTGLRATSLPSVAGIGGDKNVGLNVQGIAKAGDEVVHETSAHVAASSSYGRPLLALPAGRVTVASDDVTTRGQTGIALVGFGGGTGRYRSSSSLAEANHKIEWRSMDGRHRYTVWLETFVKRVEHESESNPLGSFAFASLGDLEAGRASSFTRSLLPVTRGARTWRGALGLGDNWQPSSTLEITGGVRFEGARFGSSAPYDAIIDSAFGRRTDHIPSELRALPTVGVSWQPGGHRQPFGTQNLPYGRFSAIIGAFRAPVDPGQIAADGAANAAATLTCIGSAAPNPEFARYVADPATIPSACRGGLPQTSPLIGTAANAVTFAPDYGGSREWKADLSWSGRLPRFARLSLNATHVRGVADPSTADLNLGPAQFTLDDEGGRPVFAPAGAFDPAAGGVSVLASRIIPTRGQVLERHADGQRRGWLLTAALDQRLPTMKGGTWNLAYTYARIRSQQRGLDAVSGGNPNTLEWGTSPYQRAHTIQVTGWRPIPSARLELDQGELESTARLSIAYQLRVSSGAPFTPFVAGDVNGDGAYDDAAFIPIPAAITDPAFSAGMDALLRDAASRTRDCLSGQAGHVAARNSCSGPWTTAFDARLELRLGRSVEHNPWIVKLQTYNLLGGVDQLVHGSNGVRGWGEHVFSDPLLLFVRSFDPERRAFAYDVNPRFGSSALSGAGIRTPFRVQMSFSKVLQADVKDAYLRTAVQNGIDWARSVAEVGGDSARLGAAAGKRRAFETYLVSANQGNTDPTRSLLGLGNESFRFTAAQLDSLRKIGADYQRERAALSRRASDTFARLVASGRPRAELEQFVVTTRRSIDPLSSRYYDRVRNVLGPDQIELWGPGARWRAAHGEVSSPAPTTP